MTLKAAVYMNMMLFESFHTFDIHDHETLTTFTGVLFELDKSFFCV